jgi:hypothetical protein
MVPVVLSSSVRAARNLSFQFSSSGFPVRKVH